VEYNGLSGRIVDINVGVPGIGIESRILFSIHHPVNNIMMMIRL